MSRTDLNDSQRTQSLLVLMEEGIQNNEADSSRHRSNSSSSKAVPEHNTSGFLWTKLRIFKHSSDCCQHQFLSPSSPSKPWFYALYFFFHVWQMRVVIVRSSDEKSILNFWFHFQMIRHIIFGLKRVFFKVRSSYRLQHVRCAIFTKQVLFLQYSALFQ